MILAALLLRPARRAPLRLAATVLGVAIGVASVVATVLASRAAVASLTEGVEAVAGPVALEVRRPGGVDEGALGLLADLADRVLLAPVVEELAELPRLGDLVRVLGVDLLLDPDARGVRGSRGEGPRDFSRELLLGRGVLLPAALAAELGVAPGDALELLARARRVELTVAGTFEPRRFASAWERVVLVDVALAQELFGRVGRLDRIEVLARRELAGAGGPSAAELAELERALAERLGPGHVVAPPSERRAQTGRMLRALDFNLTALSGISILVAIVLVATTLATSVVQRRYELALLRSLGASRAQLAWSVAAEAAAIGLAGGALGALGGWLGARAGLASVRATVAAVVDGALPGAVRLGPGLALLALGLGLGTALLAALLPLREVLRAPPLQGLREARPAPLTRRALLGRALVLALLLAGAALLAALPPVGDRPVWALCASLLLLATLGVVAAPALELLSRLHGSLAAGRTGNARLPWLRVAQAALGAGRERAGWAATAVGVAVALAVSMTTMIGSFRGTVEAWTDQALRADLFLRPAPSAAGLSTGRLDPRIVETARELFGAENVDAYHAADARVAGRRVSVGGAELAVHAREGGAPFVDGRPPAAVHAEALERGGVLVNEPFARRFGVGRGDRIELETQAGAASREVVGVFLDYSSHTGRALLDRSDFLALYPDEGPRNAAVFLPAGVEPGAARTLLLEALGADFAVEVTSNREIRREVLAIFDRTFAVTGILRSVALLVALLAMLTVLFALVSERRGELAIVRVLGGSRAQVHGIVLGEAALLGVLGALGGLGVGLAVGWVLVKIVNVQSFGWSLRFEPPWAAVLGAALGVLPVALLAGILPSLLAARLSPREVLRDDA